MLSKLSLGQKHSRLCHCCDLCSLFFPLSRSLFLPLGSGRVPSTSIYDLTYPYRNIISQKFALVNILRNFFDLSLIGYSFALLFSLSSSLSGVGLGYLPRYNFFTNSTVFDKTFLLGGIFPKNSIGNFCKSIAYFTIIW